VLEAQASISAELPFFPRRGHWFAWAALMAVSAFLLAVFLV
jgi:hypothetical protein